MGRRALPVAVSFVLLALPSAAFAQVDPYTGASATGPTPTPCPGNGQPSVTLSTYDTEIGDRITATATGYLPGLPVTFYLDGARLTEGLADASGTITVPVTVPKGPTFRVCASAPLCPAACTDPGRVRAAATVLGRGFARTGSDGRILAVIGVVFIALGWWMKRVGRPRRRRRRRHRLVLG